MRPVRFAFFLPALVFLSHAAYSNAANGDILYEDHTFSLDRHVDRSADGEISGHATASFPFRSVGAAILGWHRDQAQLNVRVSDDGSHWGPWHTLSVSADHSDPANDSAGFGLLFLSSYAKSIEWRLTSRDGSSAIPFDGSEIRFSFIDPGMTDEKTLGAIERKANQTRAAGKPPVVSRTMWGCPDGQASPNWAPVYTSVSHLVLHHTATANESDDWPAVVRSIWTFHYYTNGWFDIGYNYLIDPNGVVYEGRAGGDNAIGAHFSCANSNAMGVALLGSYESVLPSANAQQRAEELLAWKCEQQSIDPAGQSLHPGTGIVIPNICGHRDANAATNPSACPSGTECPGDALFSVLPSIRLSVAELIDADDPPSTGEKAIKLHPSARDEEAAEVTVAGVAGIDIAAGGSGKAWIALIILLSLLTIWFVMLLGRSQASQAKDRQKMPEG